jgi:hypothetical protein
MAHPRFPCASKSVFINYDDPVEKTFVSDIHRRRREHGLQLLLPIAHPRFPSASKSVFINHDDPVEKTFVIHIHRRLREHGLEVFFNRQEFKGGDNLNFVTKHVIRTASVYIAVFSPGYAGSSRCLNELMLSLESMKRGDPESTIIPVFYGVKPSELRWTEEHNNGVYAQTLRNLEEQKPSDSETIGKWRKALNEVAGKSGFELDVDNGDQGKLVDQIVKRVLKKIENHIYYDVFINHRGPDVRKTLASHLYHRFLAHGLRVFLDTEELQKGDKISGQIERAIRTASVHVGIFSSGYAESSWCLKELVLMLESRSSIIPVFYNVRPSELRCTEGGDGVYAQALDEHTKKGRYCVDAIEKWRNALSQAAMISGYEFEAFNSDEGQLVNQVVGKILTLIAEKYPRRL